MTILAATLYTGAESNITLLGTIIMLVACVVLFLPDTAVWQRIKSDRRVIVFVLILVGVALIGHAAQAAMVPCPCSTIEPGSLEWYAMFCWMPFRGC